jgi:hypothetical protein
MYFANSSPFRTVQAVWFKIYNEKYELIYDEIMPTPFNLLKIENNEIWAHGRYDKANQRYWIYRYKIM